MWILLKVYYLSCLRFSIIFITQDDANPVKDWKPVVSDGDDGQTEVCNNFLPLTLLLVVAIILGK